MHLMPHGKIVEELGLSRPVLCQEPWDSMWLGRVHKVLPASHRACCL